MQCKLFPRYDPLPIPPSKPPPVDRRQKPGASRSPGNSSRRSPERNRGDGRAEPRKHRQGEVILYGDGASVDRRTLGRVAAEVHGGRVTRDQPPPKPEKQKIHLKQATIEREREQSSSSTGRSRGSREEQAVVRELRERVEGGKRRGRGDDLTIQSREGRRTEYRASPSSSQRSGERSNQQYDSLRGSNTSRTSGSTERRTRQRTREKEGYSRSRSQGPLAREESVGRHGYGGTHREEPWQQKGRPKSWGREEEGRKEGVAPRDFDNISRLRVGTPTQPSSSLQVGKPLIPLMTREVIGQVLPR